MRLQLDVVRWLAAITLAACSVQPVTYTPEGSGSAGGPAPTCSDNLKNGDETDVDCGGACGPCSDGLACDLGADCTSGVCDVTCQAASCADGVKNGDETDVDCGGGCGPCSDGLACDFGADCTSGVCDVTCQTASCADGVKNGNETATDCGGACSACSDGLACDLGADCTSGVCDVTCQTASCADGVKNGNETATDCGGACSACSDGLACDLGADCTSGVCNVTCQAASCADGVKNGNETATDCGGACSACSDGLACDLGADCTSGVCNVTCQAASCADGVKNGNETDVDCGGATCGGCAFDRACLSDGDCALDGICDNLICRAALSCAEILAHHPAAGDGAYVIAPIGVAPPYNAVCDMTLDGGGWTLLLKADGDPTFENAAALWTSTDLVAPDDLTTAPGNAKYPAFLSLPVTTLRGDLDGFRFTKSFAGATALQIFDGPADTETPYPTFNTGAPNWSTQPNCQTFGVNIPYSTRARFGWSANQEPDCLTNDTGIGLGINDHGAGYICGSTECSQNNVDVGGNGLLWGK